jgi:hypothetical protein
MSAPLRQAAIFADAALRRVLEVIDRRRPAAQLRPMLATSLVDAVVAIGRSAAGRGPGHEGAAVLRRLRLQPAGHRDPETAAEVFGSYRRGQRVHAIACRVEQVRAGVGSRGGSHGIGRPAPPPDCALRAARRSGCKRS